MSTETRLKPDYFYHKVKANFVTKKLFFWMYRPIQMSKYNQLKADFGDKGWEINFETGMIESARAFGFGWIGLANEDNGDKSIDQEFIAYKVI